MRIKDLNIGIEIWPEPPTIISLSVELIDEERGFEYGLILRDSILVNTAEFDEVLSSEMDRIISDHPFFKLKLCESPIELRFYVYAMDMIPNLCPQIEIGPYRIDLAIPEKRVAIELDGHEFHKTREHRTRDAKRERFFQKQGWHVIRFTGTEIHQDVIGCIEEAIEIIEKLPERS